MTAAARAAEPAARERGSVFVESLIAAAIVALALGAAFRVIADGASRERALQARRTALMVAQSELAEVGSEIALRPGQSAGLAGPFTWRAEVSAYSDGQDSSAAGSLWRVVVSVAPSAGGPDLVRLESLRLGAKGG